MTTFSAVKLTDVAIGVSSVVRRSSEWARIRLLFYRTSFRWRSSHKVLFLTIVVIVGGTYSDVEFS